jgi:hypothetical protein
MAASTYLSETISKLFHSLTLEKATIGTSIAEEEIKQIDHFLEELRSETKRMIFYKPKLYC